MAQMRDLGIVCTILMVLMVGACGVETQSESAREVVVQGNLDEGRYLLDSVTVDKLTVWPVCSDEASDIGEFVTLKQAEEAGSVTIREDSANGGGQVSRVIVENRGNVPILICAGTVIKGGQQDRQIGQDSVVQARSESAVESFCVERGRWDASRGGAATQGRFTCATVAPKAVRESAQYHGDQSMVWMNVRASNVIAGKSPGTSTLLATIEEDDKERKVLRARVAAAVEEHFTSVPDDKNVVGFAYALGSKPMGMRVFADPRLFEAHFPEFLHSMAMETDLADRTVSIDAELVLNSTPVATQSGSLRGLAALNTANAVTDASPDNNRATPITIQQSAESQRPQALMSAEVLSGKPPTAADMIKMVNGINTANEQPKTNPADNRTGIRINKAGGSTKCYVPKGTGWITLSQDWTSK